MHMATDKKPKRTWVYLSEQDQQRLTKLVDAVGGSLSEVNVLTALTSAAIKACSDAGNRIPLPLRFSISSETEEFRTPESSIPLNRARK